MVLDSMNRSLSIRSKNKGQDDGNKSKHRFTMASLRGMTQPELSKKLFTLIKTQNHTISAYEQAAKESDNIAHQLSEWGLETNDEAVSEISDKLGVLLGEIGEQEEIFAQNLEDSRTVLKQIRNTESSVQPSRDKKAKTLDEISKLKYKEPTSTKIPLLEQELVRDQAESLVAEAQLTNVTRQKFKEAFDIHTAAVIERAEKQIILAKAARQILNHLDDTPVVPGQEHQTFEHGDALREILNETDGHIKNHNLDIDPVHSSAGSLGINAVPDGTSVGESSHSVTEAQPTQPVAADSGSHVQQQEVATSAEPLTQPAATSTA